MRTLLILAGHVSLVLGIIGILVPLLPTTPFLLLAAACYMRGSEPLYNWLLNHRIFGTYIKNYREGKGISLKLKIILIIMIWISIPLSAFLITQNVVIQCILFAIGGIISITIFRLPTHAPNAKKTKNHESSANDSLS